MSRPDRYLLAKPYSPDDVLREVARGFDVTVDDILSNSRSRVVVAARACAMAVVRESTDLSYPEIGRLFDRDHTTVMYHIAKVTADPELSRSVQLVVEELTPPARLFAVAEEA